MATDPKETTDRRTEHRLGDLGFTRIPAEEDPRRKNPELLAAIAKIANVCVYRAAAALST